MQLVNLIKKEILQSAKKALPFVVSLVAMSPPSAMASRAQVDSAGYAEISPGFNLERGQKLTVALIGDSITRGVIADVSLGDTAKVQDYFLIAQLTFGARSVAFLPESEGALNWKLMQQNEILARDALAAVQGSAPYSLKSRLDRQGVTLDVINAAQLGGSYRTADGQLALVQSELLARKTRNAPAVDVVIVDLGRIDFSFFSEAADFKSQVDTFFKRLRALMPNTRILVTRIAEIPRILDRPDRVGMYLVGGQPVRCSDIFRDKIAVKTRLLPGQDNSPYIAQALERWNAMNQAIADRVAAIKAEGGTIEMITTLPDRENVETWDELLASDCIHMSQRGQEQIAGVFEQQLIEILKKPSQTVLATIDDPVAGKVHFDENFVSSDHESPAAWKPEAENLWQDYENTLKSLSLQKGCAPKMWREAGPLKGSVLLYHGFTACPQQFEELASLLTAQGYRVVAPLLPGHGRAWTYGPQGEKLDETRELPQAVLSMPNSYQKDYLDLVDRMNRIFSYVEGPKAVGGLSVGGALVNFTTILRADLWDRQLIMSPLYEIEPTLMRSVFGSISNTQRQLTEFLKLWNPLLDQNLGWGQGCENERDLDYVTRYGRSEIRAGICQFKLTHAAAANQLGYEAWETMRPTMVPTQLVGVAHDPVVNKQLIFNSAGKLRNEEMKIPPYQTKERFDSHPTVRVCYLPNDNRVCMKNRGLPLNAQEKPCINHSLLSRFDSPEQNKYWIPDLNTQVVAFLTQGTYFKQTMGNRVHGDPLCSGF